MADFPKFCPYCRHTELRVKVSAWAIVTDGANPVVETTEEITLLDTEANAYCSSCGGEFTYRREAAPQRPVEPREALVNMLLREGQITINTARRVLYGSEPITADDGLWITPSTRRKRKR